MGEKISAKVGMGQRLEMNEKEGEEQRGRGGEQGSGVGVRGRKEGEMFKGGNRGRVKGKGCEMDEKVEKQRGSG